MSTKKCRFCAFYRLQIWVKGKKVEIGALEAPTFTIDELTMCMVQKRLELKPSWGGHWRVGIQDEQGTHSSCRVYIQTVGYAFEISGVLIQDVDPSFTLCCVAEVGWLPILQVFVAALRCQSCFCIKTIQSEAKASDVIKYNLHLTHNPVITLRACLCYHDTCTWTWQVYGQFILKAFYVHASLDYQNADHCTNFVL